MMDEGVMLLIEFVFASVLILGVHEICFYIPFIIRHSQSGQRTTNLIFALLLYATRNRDEKYVSGMSVSQTGMCIAVTPIACRSLVIGLRPSMRTLDTSTLSVTITSCVSHLAFTNVYSQGNTNWT
jgi:hypothetical protein